MLDIINILPNIVIVVIIFVELYCIPTFSNEYKIQSDVCMCLLNAVSYDNTRSNKRKSCRLVNNK